MSTKATKVSHRVNQSLATSVKSANDARLARDASRLAREAVSAAVAAACAAQRTDGAPDTAVSDAKNLATVTRDVRAAAEQAVAYAKDAMRAENENDEVSALVSANLSARAAQRAASLAAAVNVMADAHKELAAGVEAKKPTLTVRSREAATNAAAARTQQVSDKIDHAARYLVTYDRKIIASFSREEDAFLFESELADLDRQRATASGTCVVVDRASGERLGGYMMTNGQMLVFLRDDEYAARYGRRRR